MDNPTHPGHIDYRHVCTWFHCERPVQVTRRATERRFMSGDNKPDTIIWLSHALAHHVTFAAHKRRVNSETACSKNAAVAPSHKCGERALPAQSIFLASSEESSLGEMRPPGALSRSSGPAARFRYCAFGEDSHRAWRARPTLTCERNSRCGIATLS